jgi:hypothetical protein
MFEKNGSIGGYMRQIDDYAIEMIPIRLLISITIIAVIIILVAVASESLRISLAEHQVEQECRLVQSSLSTMIASGVARDVDAIDASEGTLRIQTITLPDSLLYLSFGGNPDPLNIGDLQPTLTENGAALFYKVQGGSTHVIWLPRETYKFREGAVHKDAWGINGAGESYIIRHGGVTVLIFEMVQKNHVHYILIHANDGIE